MVQLPHVLLMIVRAMNMLQSRTKTSNTYNEEITIAVWTRCS